MFNALLIFLAFILLSLIFIAFNISKLKNNNSNQIILLNERSISLYNKLDEISSSLLYFDENIDRPVGQKTFRHSLIDKVLKLNREAYDMRVELERINKTLNFFDKFDGAKIYDSFLKSNRELYDIRIELEKMNKRIDAFKLQ